MVICAVVGCSKRTDRDREFSFFRFPAVKNNVSYHLKKLQKIRRLLWILRINRKDFTDVQANYARVCSRHFISGKPCHVKDRKNPDWAPSLHLGYRKIKNVSTIIAKYKSYSFDEVTTENSIVSDFNSASSCQESINEEAEQVDGNSCSFDEVTTENIVSDFNNTSSCQEFINEEAEQVEENSYSFDEVTTEDMILPDFNSTSSCQEFIKEEAEQVEENSYSFDEVTTEDIIVPDFNSASSCQEFINEEAEQVEENSYSFAEVTTEDIIVPDLNSTSSCQDFINEEAKQVEENSSYELFSENNISTDSNCDSPPPPEYLDDFEEFYAEESLENA